MSWLLICVLIFVCSCSWWPFEASECYLDPAYVNRIERDLEIFKNGITPDMIQRAKDIGGKYVKGQQINPCTISIKDRRIDPDATTCILKAPYKSQLNCALEEIAKDLPNLEFVVNFIDLPYIFKHDCGTTFEQYKNGCFCDKNYIVPAHSFFKVDWKTIRYMKVPVFSQGTIPECVDDILMPSNHHFYWAVHFKSYRFIPWHLRKFKAFWRGALTDYHPTSITQNFTEISHRIRLVELCKSLPDCDAQLYTYYMNQPSPVRSKMEKDYPLGQMYSYEQQRQFKIIIDIDGSAYSERFMKLLKMGAAVFKIAAFDDIGTIAVRPWEHYIPIKMDLSDLAEKLEWARTHDEELQKIARSGRLQSLKVHSLQSFKCYFKRLLMRYHQLVQKGRGMQVNLKQEH